METDVLKVVKLKLDFNVQMCFLLFAQLFVLMASLLEKKSVMTKTLWIFKDVKNANSLRKV